MESERAKRIRSFLIGGIVGSAAGLVAFEEAPCYAETLEREAREEVAR